ncbi:MAG: threonine synthase [Anaerolineae bacterium]|nr:MAG: threonine synthase [Anaerolineae bacterium]
MLKYTGYRCSVCDREYASDEVTYTCPVDGGNLDVLLDISDLSRKTSPRDLQASMDFSMWRYLPLLPVDEPAHHGTPLRRVGWTPLYRPPRLAAGLGLKQLWLKDESTNPTASFKDRASALLVVRAAEVGAEVIITASSGNAGAALAGMAAATGQMAVILVPKTAPKPKVAQLRVYGAQVLLVDGNYDAAFDLTIEAANEFGWYCRNTAYNPFTAEGKKTAGLEIWEQVLLKHNLARPLCVFVSVGDGNIIAGIHKAFKDLHALGWLEQMPRLFGVQAEGAAAVAIAYASGVEDIRPVAAQTLADSISVDLPRDGLRALRAATQTVGAYLTVTDDEILAAIRSLGQVGVFVEPAAAAAHAGLVKAAEAGQIQTDDPCLVLLTGAGLKDTQAAIRAAGDAPIIPPTLDGLRTALGL